MEVEGGRFGEGLLNNLERGGVEALLLGQKVREGDNQRLLIVGECALIRHFREHVV